MSYVPNISYPYDVTTVTPSDHAGHEHIPIVSAYHRPIMSVMSALPLPVSLLGNSFTLFSNNDVHVQNTLEVGVNDEIVVSAMSSPFSVQEQDTSASVGIGSENHIDDEMMDAHSSSSIVLPALTSDDSNSSFSTDNNCDRSIQPSSPTSSFVLEEEIVPFSRVDNVLLDLDLPTIYGNRRPSTDTDLLMLSNSIISPSRDSVCSLDVVTANPFLPGHNAQDQFQQSTNSMHDVADVGMEFAKTPVDGGIDPCDEHVNRNSDFIENIKTRNSVFHILLQGVVGKIEQIREKTGANVTFYMIFGTSELNEKNVHKYLKAREEKLAGPNGKYSRFHLLFRKASTKQLEQSPSTSSGPSGFVNGTGDAFKESNGENDHDSEFHSSHSGSELDSDLAKDHLYAATLLRQKVSSPTVHDHQYNDDIPPGCIKSKRFDPLLCGPPPTAALENASPAAKSRQSWGNRKSPFTMNSHRHRCLRNLVETLFEKVKGLENKTGAKIMSLTISYEQNLITRQNFEYIFGQVLGIQKASFLANIAKEEFMQHFLSRKRKGQERKDSSSPDTTISMHPAINSLNSNHANSLPMLFTEIPDNVIRAESHGHTLPFTVPAAQPAALATTTTATSSSPNQITSPPQTALEAIPCNSVNTNGPTCAKCSREIPEGSRNSSEWTWLRCFNPLCFYMVHSTCLGFYVHCGSIDLRRFTFPPFYCKSHRLINNGNAQHSN